MVLHVFNKEGEQVQWAIVVKEEFYDFFVFSIEDFSDIMSQLMQNSWTMESTDMQVNHTVCWYWAARFDWSEICWGIFLCSQFPEQEDLGRHFWCEEYLWGGLGGDGARGERTGIATVIQIEREWRLKKIVKLKTISKMKIIKNISTFWILQCQHTLKGRFMANIILNNSS